MTATSFWKYFLGPFKQQEILGKKLRMRRGKFDCSAYSLRVKITNSKVETFTDAWGCANTLVTHLNKEYPFFVQNMTQPTHKSWNVFNTNITYLTLLFPLKFFQLIYGTVTPIKCVLLQRPNLIFRICKIKHKWKYFL